MSVKNYVEQIVTKFDVFNRVTIYSFLLFFFSTLEEYNRS